MIKKIQKKHGFALLEIIAGVSILSITLFGVMSASTEILKLSDITTKNIQASYLLEEVSEAIKVLRDSGWTTNIASLTAGSDYYLSFYGGEWHSTTSPVVIDGLFERKFVLQNVARNFQEDIVDSGGILDPGTKKVTVSISWPGKRGTTTKNLSFYLTNLFNN